MRVAGPTIQLVSLYRNRDEKTLQIVGGRESAGAGLRSEELPRRASLEYTGRVDTHRHELAAEVDVHEFFPILPP